MSLASLLLPSALAALAIFVASSLVHMVLPWHKSDYPKLPNEDQVMDALRPLNIPPGDYMMPRPSSMADMKTPEFAAKLARGPHLMMTVMPSGPITMGGTFVQWILFCFVVSFFGGLVAVHTLGNGASGQTVFHVVGLATFGAYTFAYWPMSIWYRRSWMITIKQTVDGLIYGLITAAIFQALWPR